MIQKHIELTQSLVESVIQSHFNTKKGEIIDLDKMSFELQGTMDDIIQNKNKRNCIE